MNHANPTQVFVATIASLLRKYKRLDEETKHNSNILISHLIEINQLSTLVDKLTDTNGTYKQALIDASLITNNRGLSFETKIKKLKEIKSKLDDRCAQLVQVTIQQQPVQITQKEKLQSKLGKNIANNGKSFVRSTQESVQAIVDIGSRPTNPEYSKIYDNIILLGYKQCDLDPKVQRIINWINPQQLGGYPTINQPIALPAIAPPAIAGGAQQMQQILQQDMEEFVELLIDVQIDASKIATEIKQYSEYINNKLYKYQSLNNDPEGKLQKMANAVAIMADKAEETQSEILDLVMDVMQCYASMLPPLEPNIIDLNKEFLQISNKLTKQNNIIVKNDEKLQYETKWATKKANTLNLLAIDSILSNTIDIFASGSHFAKSTNTSNALIKTAAQTLDKGDKKGIEAAHNSIKQLSADNTKNILNSVGENHENLNKLENRRIIGAANVLYTFASANKNENAGTYASLLYGPATINPLPIIVAAKMSGTMYAINKNVSQEKCGNVATESIIGFLKAITVAHLMAAPIPPVGDYLHYADTGIPSYPTVQPANVGGIANGAHSAFTVGAPQLANQQVAENVANIVAELMAHGKDINNIIAAAKAVAGVTNLDYPRIEYVIRELVANSKYLQHIVPEQAAGNPVIANAAGVPAGDVVGGNPDAIDGGIYRGGAIANIRVVDNDVYYTVINIATSVYVSTGDEQMATNAGIAIGKLMVMYKYGHYDLIRVQSHVAAYIGIYSALSLVMLGKSVDIAAKTGFIFGQGWEHHENVRVSLDAAILQPFGGVGGPRTAIYNPAPVVLAIAAVGPLQPNIGGLIEAEALGLGGVGGLPALNANDQDQYLKEALTQSQIQNTHLNNAAYIATPLLYRTIATAHNTLRAMRSFTAQGNAAAALGRVDRISAVAPLYPNGPLVQAPALRGGAGRVPLTKLQYENLIKVCRDAFQTATNAALPMNISNIRIAFKLFWKIVSLPPPAAVNQMDPIIDANYMAPYEPNVGITGAAAGTKIILTHRPAAAGPPLITPSIIDTVSDLLFTIPANNEVRYDPIPPIQEYASLALTDDEMNKIQNFAAMRVTEWIGLAAGPVGQIIPTLNTNNFQHDIYQFNALNTTKKCHYSLASVSNWNIFPHNYKTLYLNNNNVKDVKYPVELTPELVRKSKNIKPRFRQAIDDLEKYVNLIKQVDDNIESYKNDTIATNVINAIYLSANAQLQILKSSSNIIENNDTTSITDGVIAKDVANKEISKALDKILAAYDSIGNPNAFGQLTAADGIQLMDTLKRIIKSNDNIIELVSTAEFATNAYNEFDPKKCLILTAAEAGQIGAPQIIAPNIEYHRLNMILSAVMAVCSAMKTIKTSDEILLSGRLKKNANNVNNDELKREQFMMDKAFVNVKKMVEQFNIDSLVDQDLLTIQVRGLLEKLTAQYNYQRLYYRQYRQYYLRSSEYDKNDEFHKEMKQQYKMQTVAFEMVKKMVSVIIITYIKLLTKF